MDDVGDNVMKADFKSIAAAAIIATVSGMTSAAADQFVFRYRLTVPIERMAPMTTIPPGETSPGETVTVRLGDDAMGWLPASLRMLDTGRTWQVPVTATGDVASFRSAAGAVMPGFSVDPASGMISGTFAAGDYRFRVDALDASGAIIATSDVATVTIVALTAISAPPSIDVSNGTVPATLIHAAGGGGGYQWTLSSGNDWLEIVSAGADVAMVRLKAGATVPDFYGSSTETITACDFEFNTCAAAVVRIDGKPLSG